MVDFTVALRSQEVWKKLRKADCTLCDLHKSAQSVCLIGLGPIKARLMFVGEAPGEREDDIQKPFAGRAGKVLDLILGAIRLSRNEIFISNAAKCRPPENRDPVRGEVRICSDTYLSGEIGLVKPELIVCLGRWATVAVLETPGSIEGSRRQVFKSRFDEGTPVIVTYHPSICFHRGPHYGTIIADDIKWAMARVLDGKGQEKEDFKILDAHKIHSFPHRTTWALDVESNGDQVPMFSPEYRLISMAACANREAAVFVHGEQETIDSARVLLEDPSKVVVGHSIKFDLKSLRLRGLKRKEVKAKIRDTLVMASLCDENYPNRKLQHLAVTRLGAEPWKDEVRAAGVSNTNKEDLRVYNTKDGIWDYRLYWDLNKDIKRQELEEILELDMDTTRTLVEVELKGIQISEKAFKNMCEVYSRKITKLREKIGVENPESTQQVSRLLYDKLKLLPPEGEERGKLGYYSTKEEVLLKLRDYDTTGMVKRILRYRMRATRKKFFLDGLDGQSGLLPLLDGKFRVHPTFNIAKVPRGGGEKDEEGGTTSGRTSCKDPNFQQFPREQEDIPREENIRGMVVSKFEGGSIGSADYIQGEVFLAACESRDPWMLGLLEQGEDFHLLAAADFTKKAKGLVTKFERKKAKGAVFGKIYRAGIWKVARTMGTTYEEAEKWWMWFTQRAAKLEQWCRDVEREILDKGQTRHAGGRIRHLPGASRYTREGREALRSGINMRIQGLLGDITKRAMNRVQHKFWDGHYKTHVIGIVHDELVSDIYPGEEGAYAEISFREMEKAQFDLYSNIPLPMKVDVKIGPSWLDTRKVRREEYV